MTVGVTEFRKVVSRNSDLRDLQAPDLFNVVVELCQLNRTVTPISI